LLAYCLTCEFANREDSHEVALARLLQRLPYLDGWGWRYRCRRACV